MPDTGSVTMTGFNEFALAMVQFPPELEKALQEVARDTAERIATRARRLVPVRSGRTKNSIRVVADLKHHRYYVEVGPHEGMPADKDWPANLSIWIEFGTRYKSARPFMRPAVDAERDPYGLSLEAAAIRILKRMFG
jgi:HK97 gp10 family phage protein